jgi:hypothetical protein
MDEVCQQLGWVGGERPLPPSEATDSCRLTSSILKIERRGQQPQRSESRTGGCDLRTRPDRTQQGGVGCATPTPRVGKWDFRQQGAAWSGAV